MCVCVLRCALCCSAAGHRVGAEGWLLAGAAGAQPHPARGQPTAEPAAGDPELLPQARPAPGGHGAVSQGNIDNVKHEQSADSCSLQCYLIYADAAVYYVTVL